MSENTPEFDRCYESALRHLEDEDTDIFLLATGRTTDVNAIFGYNENSDIPPEKAADLLAALLINLDLRTGKPIAEILSKTHKRIRELESEL